MTMIVPEITLPLVALLTLILIIARRRTRPTPAPSPEVDLAATYRQGLHAVIRLHTAAQVLEQELYAQAVRNAEQNPPEPKQSPVTIVLDSVGVNSFTKSKN
jgi:hypothetical protein